MQLCGILLTCLLAAAQPQPGRYIRVETDATHTAEVHLAELEVYAGGRNVALKQPATASSSLGNFTPGRAVDGIVEYAWGPDASFWTSSRGGAQWWEVDLGQVRAIERLVLYNRFDCCHERLDGAVLRVLDADRHEVYRQVLSSVANPIEKVWVEPVLPLVDLRAATLAERRAALAPHFRQPAADPAEVMPVGAGDLSAMVSYRDALELHLSKPDYYGTEAKPYHLSPTMLSPGHVRLDFGLPGAALQGFDQWLDFDRGSVRLSLATAAGPLTAEVWGAMGDNALLVTVDDPRPQPAATLTLSCSRATMTLTGQTLREVRNPAVAPTDRLYRLGVATTAGLTPLGHHYSLVLACHTSRDGQPEVVAERRCAELLATDLAALRATQLAWWQRFWEQSWLDLRGKDADYLTRLWYTGYYSYAGVAATATVPPKFNGGPGLVRDDERSWGWGYWWQNTRELIWPMYAANRLDLARKYLDFYDAQFPDWQRGTRAQGKLGIRMWEGASPPAPGSPAPHQPTAFGPEALARAAADLRMEQCKSGYNARSVCQSTELAQLMLDYAAYADDPAYEKDVAGPWLREAALFWLSWLRRGEDGLYHSMVSDAAEMWWKVKDPAPDLSAARWCCEQTLARGARLGFEPGLLALVKDRLDHLAPLPVGNVKRKGADVESFDRAAEQLAPFGDLYDDRQSHNMENPELYPVYPFGTIDAHSAPADYARAVAAFRARRHPNAGGWSQCPVQAARLQLPETLSVIMDHARRHQKYPYGGWNSPGNSLKGSKYGVTDVPYFDSVGVNLTAVQESLVQDHTGVVELLPAVSRGWAGRYRLRVRGALLEVEFQAQRQVTRVVVTGTRAGTVRLANPWARSRSSRGATESGERVLALDLRAGETLTLVEAR